MEARQCVSPPPGVTEELVRLLRQGAADLSVRVVGIPLEERGSLPLQGEWYMVYTMAEGEVPLALALHAPAPVIRRASVHMLGEEEPVAQDMEECAMEYMNVLSGWVVSQLYQQLGRSVMLYPPRLRQGGPPQAGGRQGGGMLHFATDQGEPIVLQWVCPACTHLGEALFLR